MKILPFFIVLITICVVACRKDSYITNSDAVVRITVDTLKYDTVFTSSGSITQSFKIVNENNRKIRLSSVKLMGTGSAYSINVDGTSGPAVNDLELAANDSLYVFVQVNINPNASNLPFVIRDSIQVSFNGKMEQVQLEAWGKNAHFMRNKQVTSDEIWNDDLPYVILGYLYIAPGQKLTINRGCHVYAHADAAIIVDGTLQVNGEKDSSGHVIFRGDRLDDPYKDYPAAWPGIYFRNSSQGSNMSYAVIRNAYQAVALQDPSPDANPKLIMNQCIVDNAYDAGIISLHSSIRAINCLISNCGKNLVLAQGGNYEFTHCTVASYSNTFILHKEPVLYLSNFILVNNSPVANDLNAVFTNNIFWGDSGTVDDEVVTAKVDGAAFNAGFDSNLWRVKNEPAGISPLVNEINNQAPQFDSIDVNRNHYDFHLKADPLSPAIDVGKATTITVDLDGNPRPVGKPDLGCYENQ